MLYQGIKFCYDFRDYQQRVLNTLKDKLNDNKVHVVAAPGSGKTVLGLEIVRRLDRPVLVLTPSISIREQWTERFISLFTPKELRDAWRSRISTDLDNPGVITCVTYQAVFCDYKDENLSELASRLKKSGVGVVVLDEAHHLKKEWWKALKSLTDALGKPIMVALTATPPYDSTDREWARYNELCGEIDIEIHTPEMVQKGTLCPYQDFVYPCIPTEEEKNNVIEELTRNNTIIAEVLKSRELYEGMRLHPAMLKPGEFQGLFASDTLLLTAFVSYVKYYGRESALFYEESPAAADRLIRHWDAGIRAAAEKTDVPELTGDVFLSLMNAIVSNAEGTFGAEYAGDFKEFLKGRHLIKNGRTILPYGQDELEKKLSNSASRINAVCEIAEIESRAMGEQLRLLVLVDNIGREDIPKIESDEALTQMNCVSVFERLRRHEHLTNIDEYMGSSTMTGNGMNGQNLALLCGSMCLIKAELADRLDGRCSPVGNTGYVQIPVTDSNRKNIVAEVTRLIEEGSIRIIIGTVALLGEGWDSPPINTVIMGSTISSYVQTNQMRGRGLRIDPVRADKTANIWHLVTLVPDIEGDFYNIGDEYRKLEKRFDIIMGIDNTGFQVSSGIERVGLKSATSNDLTYTREEINNYKMTDVSYALNRALVREQWKHVILDKKDLSIVRNVVCVMPKPRFRWFGSGNGWSRYEIRRIAVGLIRTLKDMGLIDESIQVQIRTRNDRGVGVALAGGTARENNLFVASMKQMLSQNMSTKYILMKRQLFRRPKYIATPECIHNKQDAGRLIENLKLGELNLIPVRSEQGMGIVLATRYGRNNPVKEIMISGNGF